MNAESPITQHTPSALAVAFQSEVSRCTSFSGLKRTCLRFASRAGFRAVTYHHLPPIGALDQVGFNLICVGFPEELVANFENNNPIELDPMAKQILRGTRAYWWDATPRPGRMAKTEREQLDYAKSLVGNGIHLPVFGPNGRNGYVSLGFGQARPNWTESDLSNLQLCCQLAHQQYCHLLLATLPIRSQLSPREEEILSWAAKGKSNGAIADILDITESSVITYLERAFKKLGVDSRVSAALRASSSGELKQLP